MKNLFMFLLLTSPILLAQDYYERRHRGPRHHGPPPEALIMSADTDYNHEISADEWSAFIENLPYTEEGQIDLAELHARSAHHRANRPGQKEHNQRNHPLDQNGDGVLAEEDLQSMFGELDRDGDGHLSSSELPKPPKRGHRRGGPGKRGRHHNFGGPH